MNDAHDAVGFDAAVVHDLATLMVASCAKADDRQLCVRRVRGDEGDAVCENACVVGKRGKAVDLACAEESPVVATVASNEWTTSVLGVAGTAWKLSLIHI